MTRIAAVLLAALLALLVWVTNAPADGPSLAPNLDAITTALAGIHVAPVTGYDAGSPTPVVTPLPPKPTTSPAPTPSPPPTRTPRPHRTPPPTPTPEVIVITHVIPPPAPPVGAVETAIQVIPPTPAPGAGAPPYTTWPYGCGSTCGGGGTAGTLNAAPVTGP